MTIQQVLATLGFLSCVALLVHHLLGARHQARFALWWRARLARLRLGWTQLRRSRQQLSMKEQAQGRAEREAADLIERARRGADRSGNVIRPDRFRDRPKDQRRDLH